VTSPSSSVTPILTDRDGRFTFAVPPGAVTVAASKTGFARREASGTTGSPIEVRLARGAAISGRVVDGRGDPIVDARVVAEIGTTTGAGFTVAAATQTDDRGEYRLGSLAADTFRVAILTRGEPTRLETPGGFTILGSVVKTYYPDAVIVRDDRAPIASGWPDTAEALSLAPGDDRASVDFVVPGGQPGFLDQQVMMMAAIGSPPATASAVEPAGIVRGRVTATDGRAVPRAQVRLMPVPPARQPGVTTPPRPLAPRMAKADDDGRFELGELAAGSYRLVAVKTGYSQPGEPESPAGVPALTSGLAVNLGDGEIHERADLTLARWGTLAGRVFDELGDPIQGVSVQLFQVRYQAGRRRLVAAGGASHLTDDLGRFRTYGIAPGRYIVSTTIGDVATTDVPGYARSYFPGTPNPGEAQFVSIGASQDVTGIDISMARTQTAMVSGTLLDASGTPSTQGSVRLITSQQSPAATSVSVGARLTTNGHFEFPNVTPGNYVIQVDRGRRGVTEGEFGALAVAVNGTDVKDLVLKTSIGSSITGRVTFDSYLGTAIPRTNAVEIAPRVVDPDQSPTNAASADIHDDWSFEVHGINGPRRLQVVRAPAEWTLKEIRVRGIDATDRTIAFGRSDQSLADVEVVLTDRVNTLTGTITDDHARPAPGAHLIVFAPDRDRWYSASRYLRTASAAADGSIAVTGLPTGTYYAVAVAALPADGDDAWQEAAYLESLLPRAVTITFGEGQKQVVNLKLETK
jgi:hypothetical protein